jgi:hypothetical protein
VCRHICGVLPVCGYVSMQVSAKVYHLSPLLQEPPVQPRRKGSFKLLSFSLRSPEHLCATGSTCASAFAYLSATGQYEL